jgi:hypothetical protein
MYHQPTRVRNNVSNTQYPNVKTLTRALAHLSLPSLLLHSFRCTVLRTVPFVRHFLCDVPLSGGGSYVEQGSSLNTRHRHEMTYQTRTPAQYCNVNTNTSTFQTYFIITLFPLLHLTLQVRATYSPSWSDCSLWLAATRPSLFQASAHRAIFCPLKA